MSQASALAFSTWEAPSWADERSVDEGSVFHEHRVGELTLGDEGRPYQVSIFQRDGVDLLTTPVTFTRDDPRVRVDGIHLTSAEARQLAGLLIKSCDIVDGGADS